MKNTIFNIIIEDSRWNDALSSCDLAVDNIVDNLCIDVDVPLIIRDKKIEINIVLSNDENIKILNGDYRNQNKSTNVLSFALVDDCDAGDIIKQCNDCGDAIPAGDVIIALETIKKESEEQKKKFEDHFRHILIHGILHILGYDHVNEEDALIMEEIEVKLLNNLNIDNPYG